MEIASSLSQSLPMEGTMKSSTRILGELKPTPSSLTAQIHVYFGHVTFSCTDATTHIGRMFVVSEKKEIGETWLIIYYFLRTQIDK
jgi:hypothetical protein